MAGPGGSSPLGAPCIRSSTMDARCPIDTLPAALIQSVVQRVLLDLGSKGELRRAGMVPLVCSTWRSAFEAERSSSEPLEMRIRQGTGMDEHQLERDLRALGLGRVTALVLERDSVVALGAILAPREGALHPWTHQMRTLSLCRIPLAFADPTHAACALPSLTSLSFQLPPSVEEVIPSWLAHLPSLLHLSVEAPEDGGPPSDEVDALPIHLLPPTLHSLRLRNLKLRALPPSVASLGHLTELRILGLWRLSALPTSLGTDLPLLQFLQIHECSALAGLPHSVTALGSLAVLDVHSCPRLASTLPRLGPLLRSSLRLCQFSAYQGFLRLPSFPTDLPSCARLEILTLSSKTLTRVPDSLGELRKLRCLRLEMDRLAALPDVFASLAGLTELVLLSEALTELPPSLAGSGSPSRLRTLGLFCPSLRRLPSGFGSSGSLRTLTLSGCYDSFGCQLASLPPSFGCLHRLQVGASASPACAPAVLCGPVFSLFTPRDAMLLVHGSTYMYCLEQGLHSAAIALYCSALRLPYDGWADMPSVRWWQALCIAARALRDLPVEAAPRLMALRELRVQYWDGPPEVLEGFVGRLPALEALSLICASGRLTQLPASLRRAGGTLQRLQIEHTTLPSEERSRIRRGEGIVVMWARHCMNLATAHQAHPSEPGGTLPAGILDGLASLTSLHINCSLIASLPPSFTDLSALQRLRLTNGHLLRSPTEESTAVGSLGMPGAPKSLGSQGILEVSSRGSLGISEAAKSLGSLEILGFLRTLEDLRLEGLGLVEELPQSLSALTGLTSLHVQHMRKLRVVPVWPSWGKQLRKLRLLSCPLLSCAGEQLSALSRLESLKVDCTFMHPQRPPCLGSLKHLADLTVVRICRAGGHKTRLPDSLGSLPSLKSVTANTSCLGELPASVSVMTGLTCLDVDTGPHPDETLHRLMYRTGLLFVPPLEGLRRLPLAQRSRLSARRQSLCNLNWLHTSWLPDNLQCFAQSLKRLTLDQYCGARLPPALRELQALNVLWLKDCPRLKETAPELALLPHLRHLDLERCPQVEAIAGVEQGFPSLELFSVSCCDMLQRRRQNPFRARFEIRVYGLDNALTS